MPKPNTRFCLATRASWIQYLWRQKNVVRTSKTKPWADFFSFHYLPHLRVIPWLNRGIIYQFVTIFNTWRLLCRSQWSKSPWAMYSIMSRIGLVVVQHPKKLRTFWCFPTFFMSSISSINSFLSSSLAFSGNNKNG